LGRVLKSLGGRNRVAALAVVHEYLFAFRHCAIGDLLDVLGQVKALTLAVSDNAVTVRMTIQRQQFHWLLWVYEN
jgi:hypothetical protein